MSIRQSSFSHKAAVKPSTPCLDRRNAAAAAAAADAGAYDDGDDAGADKVSTVQCW